jgi:hypothetical protein
MDRCTVQAVELDRPNGTGKTGKAERNRQNRTGRTGQIDRTVRNGQVYSTGSRTGQAE